MSGAAGHLSHLYENRSLRFRDLKEVLTMAASGTLEEVTEKFDGMNVVFSWDEEREIAKIARNSTDITEGGMDEAALRQRFEGRGAIAQAFALAHQVLTKAIAGMPARERLQVFYKGKSRIWYSAEVIYPTGTSTINYDTNCIVFHGRPVFEQHIHHLGHVVRTDDAAGFKVLKQSIESMQKAVNLRGWKVMAPVMVRLNDITAGTALHQAMSAIDSAMSAARCSDNDTIEDYLYSMAFDRARALGLNPSVAAGCANRLLNKKGAPNVVALTKMAPQHRAHIETLVKRDKLLIAEFIKPIEIAINNLACAVLHGMHSVLIDNSTTELHRLRDDVQQAISHVKSTGNIEHVQALEKQLMKMHGIDNITSTMEGIVFVFKGQAYKLTGAWAPAHQILSLYQRTNAR